LIEQIFSRGGRFTVFPYRVFYLEHPPNQPLQAGFGISSRIFKRAVDRNRIKRLGREVYRVQKNPLAGELKQTNRSLALFFVYTAKELPVYADLYEKMKLILEKLMELGNEKNSSGH
jgi:ribonuclease P protein component